MGFGLRYLGRAVRRRRLDLEMVLHCLEQSPATQFSCQYCPALAVASTLVSSTAENRLRKASQRRLGFGRTPFHQGIVSAFGCRTFEPNKNIFLDDHHQGRSTEASALALLSHSLASVEGMRYLVKQVAEEML